jgi:hypothetical protein
MKTVGGKKLVQFVILFTVVAIFGYSIVENLYGPFPTDKGFPLKPLWETKLNDNIKQVIVSENGHILVRLGYSVNSLSTETGALLWKYRVDDPLYSIASYNGIIYVVGKNTLFTIDERTGNPVWQQAVNISAIDTEIQYVDDHSIVISVIGGVFVYNSKTGELNAKINYGNGIVDTCVYGNVLYTIHSDIEAHNLSNGDLLWRDNSTSFTRKAICESNVAYFIKNDSELIAYDLLNKSQIWSLPFNPTDPYTLDNIFITQDFLVVEGLHNFFTVDKNNGPLLHTVATSQHIGSMTAINNNLFIFYIYRQAIYSYDINTWETTGILQYSLPKVAAIEVENFQNYKDQLILWKNKRIFVYR